MLTSKQLLNRLDEIIELSYIDFTYRVVGEDFLSQAEKDKLMALGLIVGQRPLIENLYLMIRQRGTQGYKEDATFQEMLQVITDSGVLPDLSEEAEYTLDHFKAKMKEAIDDVKENVKRTVKERVLEQNLQFKEELQEKNAAVQPTLRREIQDKNSKKLLNSLTLGAVAGTALTNFRRDFTTNLTEFVNSTTVDDIRRLASIQAQAPGDSLVYKQIVDDSRTSVECRSLHTIDGTGSNPRIYRLSELIANGTNVGKPRSQWKAVVSGTHPGCRCQLKTATKEMIDKLKNKKSK